MRTWVKVMLWGAAVALVAFIALAATSSYFVFRHLEAGSAKEADIVRQIEGVRARYGGRQPLIELADPRSGDIRVHRSAHPGGQRATTMHVLTWNSEDGEKFETDVPLWLMSFSSVNVLSHLGIAPDRFRLTTEDVKTYGPGIVAHYAEAGRKHVLIWAE